LGYVLNLLACKTFDFRHFVVRHFCHRQKIVITFVRRKKSPFRPSGRGPSCCSWSCPSCPRCRSRGSTTT
jgi:hypothetical protein